MLRIKITIGLMLCSIVAFAQPQSAGEIYGYNNSLTRGRVKIVGDQLKVWDSTMASLNSLMKLKLDSIYTKSDSSYQRSTLKISQLPSITLAAGTNNIGDVDVVSSALPTGAATSANQTNGSQKVQLVDGGSTGTLSQAESNAPFAGIVAQGYNRISDEARYLTLNGSDNLFVIDSAALSLLTSIYIRQNDTSGWKKSIKVSEMPAISVTSGASTVKDSSSTNTSMTVTNLNSLANSATAGWQSVRVSNVTTQSIDYKIFVKLTMANTAPANDKAAYVYICPFYTTDAGTTWYASSQGTTTLPTGSEGTTTIATPNNLRLLGVLSYTTQNMVLQDSWLISNTFGDRMPDGFSIIVINYTGAAISASGNIVAYSPIFQKQ